MLIALAIGATMLAPAASHSAAVVESSFPAATAPSPRTLVADGPGGLLYRSDPSGSIGIHSTSTWAQTGTIALTSTPGNLALDPSRMRLYIATDLGVDAVDTATDLVVATYPTAAAVKGLAFDPSTDRVYALAGHTLHVIAGTTMTEATTLSIPGFPHDVAIDPARARLYITDRTGSPGLGRLMVYDAATLTFVTSYLTGPLAEQIAIDLQRNRVWFTTETGIGVLDVASGVTLSRTVGPNPEGLAVDAALNSVYVTDPTDATVTVLRSSDGQVMSTVSIAGAPMSATVDPTTLRALVADASTTWVIAADDVAPTTTATAAPVNEAEVTNGRGRWTREHWRISLTCTDAFPGCARSEVKHNGGILTTVNGTMLIDGEGEHSLQYRSVDRAGATEAFRSLTGLWIDQTGPDAQLSLAEGTILRGESPELTVVATDPDLDDGQPGIGVQSVCIELVRTAMRPINPGLCWPASLENGTWVARPSTGPGAYDVRAVATDAVGNTAASAPVHIIYLP